MKKWTSKLTTQKKKPTENPTKIKTKTQPTQHQQTLNQPQPPQHPTKSPTEPPPKNNPKTQPQQTPEPDRETTRKLAGNFKQLATCNPTKQTKENKNCDNCRYTSDQLQTAKKQIKELEKELERSTKETTQQKKDALKTTEKMKNELKTHKLQVIDLKTQERETQEKLQSVSEQLDSAIERLTKREDEINRLQTTLTNQPQPSNINQLNQQLITKHKDEISNLTNIIEEKDTIIDQLIEDRIKHKQQPTAQPQRQQQTTLNTKKPINDHIKEIERKTEAALQTALGDDNYQGIEMETIWTLIESCIIPIITYGYET